MKRVYFTVTNDLTYDQRMQRICSTLADNNYSVTLVGRRLKTSVPLVPQMFQQKRLRCLFNKGLLFYAEYNLRLFWFLLFRGVDAICAIDLDTILPCLFVSRLRRLPAVYDAHEFFTEMKEVRERRLVQYVWTGIEKFAVPKFRYCYTVSEGLANEFAKRYRKKFEIIRNMPRYKNLDTDVEREPFLFYGGAVNHARGFEYLIPAMKEIPRKLVICGDGNFMQEVKALISQHQLEHRIELRGMVPPEELFSVAQKACLGLNLVEKEGLSQYYSLANKFFDYIQAGLPQISMNFPEYRSINDSYGVAILIDELTVEVVRSTIQNLLADGGLLNTLAQNTLQARKLLCWENEQQKLLELYKEVFTRQHGRD